MNLITADHLSNELEAQFSSAQSIKIITGYLTLSAAEFLLNSISDETTVQLIVRARPQDLISGATDIDAIKLLFKNGVRCHIHRTLHAKLYVIDNKYGFIGSANFTSNGLKLSGYGNFELSTKTKLTDKDNGLIREVFNDSIMVTKRVIETLEGFVSSSSATPELDSSTKGWWNELIAPEASYTCDRLYISDLPWVNLEQDLSSLDESSENFLHDVDVFGLEVDKNGNARALNFQKSKIYQFLTRELSSKENKELYFGELTSKVHDLLVDEPMPYRSDIKQLVFNLLIYCKVFSMGILTIDTPSYSTRIKLANRI
ncbi:phospholipase D family protein [Parashewanella tropica]|uniref:phospholipase D family protein n=1 Tax=Parashewanella tropica TaxID=2547970 RepID=UPI0014791FC8|nr:phospholipase D family protein [Parashewanella tropica]